MTLFILTLSIILLCLCLPQGSERKGFLGIIVALICLPLGVILALAKKYK